MIKKLLLMVLTVSMLVLSASGVWAADEITLKLNDLKLTSDVPPVIKNGRTLVPVRTVSTALGADVSWDAQAQKVSIIKNSDVIELTINKETLTKNGQETKIDVPAQLINGRTMVPVAVIANAFGAEVKWDNASRTVAVNYTETKDGLTAEELVQKVNEVTQKEKTYKLAGNVSAELSIASQKQTFGMNITIEGAYRKTADEQETYIKEVVSIPLLASTPQGKMTVEIFTNGKTYWQKAEGQDWVKSELPLDAGELAELQDPNKLNELAKAIGLQYVFGNDKVIDGKNYYTVIATFDQEKIKTFLHDIMMKTLTAQLTPAGSEQKLSESDLEQLNQIIASMDFVLYEKFYVEKESLLISKTELDGQVKVSAEGETVVASFKGDIDSYGYGESVEMPVLK